MRTILRLRNKEKNNRNKGKRKSLEGKAQGRVNIGQSLQAITGGEKCRGKGRMGGKEGTRWERARGRDGRKEERRGRKYTEGNLNRSCRGRRRMDGEDKTRNGEK